MAVYSSHELTELASDCGRIILKKIKNFIQSSTPTIDKVRGRLVSAESAVDPVGPHMLLSESAKHTLDNAVSLGARPGQSDMKMEMRSDGDREKR